MKRHFYISDDLDELEDVEVELEERGISCLLYTSDAADE